MTTTAHGPAGGNGAAQAAQPTPAGGRQMNYAEAVNVCTQQLLLRLSTTSDGFLVNIPDELRLEVSLLAASVFFSRTVTDMTCVALRTHAGRYAFPNVCKRMATLLQKVAQAQVSQIAQFIQQRAQDGERELPLPANLSAFPSWIAHALSHFWGDALQQAQGMVILAPPGRRWR